MGDFLLMFGMGMFAFLCLWPGFIVLNVTGIEPFALPQTYDDFVTIILPLLLDAVFIASFIIGITLNGAIFMSLGALAVIPASFVVDVWFHGLEVTWLAVIGSFFIFFSFVVIEIPTKKITACYKEIKR